MARSSRVTTARQHLAGSATVDICTWSRSRCIQAGFVRDVCRLSAWPPSRNSQNHLRLRGCLADQYSALPRVSTSSRQTGAAVLAWNPPLGHFAETIIEGRIGVLTDEFLVFGPNDRKTGILLFVQTCNSAVDFPVGGRSRGASTWPTFRSSGPKGCRPPTSPFSGRLPVTDRGTAAGSGLGGSSSTRTVQ